MTINSIPTAALVGLTAFAVSACSSNTQLLNQDIQQAIEADQVDKVKLYVDAEGKVIKRSLYVSRAAVPAWVVQFADEKIGKGSGEYFEMEWYAEAPTTRVYEVTRVINGAKTEISVNENKQLRYIEKEVTAKSLPQAVRAAVSNLAGFRATEYEQKTGPGIDQYQVEGSQNGSALTYTFDAAGGLLSKQKSLQAELEVSCD